MQSIHYFAGANTARGFESCFDNILPPDMRKRMFFIKGGPGVGKSSLMRRVGEEAEKQGLKVCYFHCSSDPDSLDGVCLPERGIGLMDGTAPHVYDPSVPGARDVLLSLGDYLDERRSRRMPERSPNCSAPFLCALAAVTAIWRRLNRCCAQRRWGRWMNPKLSSWPMTGRARCLCAEDVGGFLGCLPRLSRPKA